MPQVILSPIDPRMPRLVHTYSIVARDPQTGQMGMAVQSHYFSVGQIMHWAEAGVGVVAAQAFGGSDFASEMLALLRQGLTAKEALTAMLKDDSNRDFRQVGAIDARGNVAAHTGARCTAAAGHLTGDNFTVQANVMLNDSIWPAMKRAYEGAGGDLADRMIAALEGAQAAGGDLRGQQSSAMIIVSGERKKKPWEGVLLELRVEDHPQPVAELKRLIPLHRAHQLLNQARLSAMAGKFDDVTAAMTKATALAPDQIELRFYLAMGLFGAGREQQALQIFREVFAQEPRWAELVPRLVPRGMFRNDPAVLKRITDQKRQV